MLERPRLPAIREKWLALKKMWPQGKRRSVRQRKEGMVQGRDRIGPGASTSLRIGYRTLTRTDQGVQMSADNQSSLHVGVFLRRPRIGIDSSPKSAWEL